MRSILEWLDDLIRGGLHRLVDRALEDSSLILFDQDMRDVDAAIDHLEEATATMYAAARANERRLNEHQQDVERLERRLERLTAEGVEPMSERVMVTQARLEATRGLVADTQMQIERQQGRYEMLKRRLTEAEMLSQALQESRPNLESLLVLARAYRSVDRVALTLEGLRGIGGDPQVSMVADSIYQRFNEAQARLDAIHLGEDLAPTAELAEFEVEDQLAERRRRLGLEPEPEGVETAAKPQETPTQPAPPEAPAPETEPEEPAPTPEPPADLPSPCE